MGQLPGFFYYSPRLFSCLHLLPPTPFSQMWTGATWWVTMGVVVAGLEWMWAELKETRLL